MPVVGNAVAQAQAQRLVRDLLLLLSRRFMGIARRKTESETIRRTLRATLEPQTGTAFVEAPQYWAPYYHDGRGRVRPRRPGVRFLVFYKDRLEDPRKPSQAQRAFQLRRLSHAEFVRDARAGKLVLRREVRPSRPHPFFLRAHAEFARPGALRAAVEQAVSRHLVDDFVKSERATFRLPL